MSPQLCACGKGVADSSGLASRPRPIDRCGCSGSRGSIAVPCFAGSQNAFRSRKIWALQVLGAEPSSRTEPGDARQCFAGTAIEFARCCTRRFRQGDDRTPSSAVSWIGFELNQPLGALDSADSRLGEGKAGGSAASVAFGGRNGTNLKQCCKTRACGENSITVACYLCNTHPKTAWLVPF